jgi:hypothetical protein
VVRQGLARRGAAGLGWVWRGAAGKKKARSDPGLLVLNLHAGKIGNSGFYFCFS